MVSRIKYFFYQKNELQVQGPLLRVCRPLVPGSSSSWMMAPRARRLSSPVPQVTCFRLSGAAQRASTFVPRAFPAHRSSRRHFCVSFPRLILTPSCAPPLSFPTRRSSRRRICVLAPSPCPLFILRVLSSSCQNYPPPKSSPWNFNKRARMRLTQSRAPSRALPLTIPARRSR